MMRCITVAVMPLPDGSLTSAEAAERIGSMRTLRRLVHDKVLTPVWQGQGKTSAQYFHPDDIEKYLAKKAAGGAS